MLRKLGAIILFMFGRGLRFEAWNASTIEFPWNERINTMVSEPTTGTNKHIMMFVESGSMAHVQSKVRPRRSHFQSPFRIAINRVVHNSLRRSIAKDLNPLETLTCEQPSIWIDIP